MTDPHGPRGGAACCLVVALFAAFLVVLLATVAARLARMKWHIFTYDNEPPQCVPIVLLTQDHTGDAVACVAVHRKGVFHEFDSAELYCCGEELDEQIPKYWAHLPIDFPRGRL